MNNVNGVIVGIDIQDKITQAAIWDEQTEMVIHVTGPENEAAFLNRLKCQAGDRAVILRQPVNLLHR